MKKNLGSSAGLLALLAVSFHLVEAPQSEKVTTPQARSSSETSVDKSTDSLGPEKPREPRDIEGPWLATQAFFHAEPQALLSLQQAAPGSLTEAQTRPLDLSEVTDLELCSQQEGCRAQLISYFGWQPNHSRFLLATIPDPRHTRLSLDTDSSLEAIGQAAYDSHWEFAGQWLPWYSTASSDKETPEGRRKQRLQMRREEKQPGLLIFRHSPSGTGDGAQSEVGTENPIAPRFDSELLFIFLVGETPTLGINGLQFRAARAYMRALGDEPYVRMATPSFSGSFYSLAQLIKTERASPSGLTITDRIPYQYRIFTGTATSTEAAQAFQKDTAVVFNATGANADDQNRQFAEILRNLDIPVTEAGVLVEDESGFSKGYSKSHSTALDGLHVLRFPREISHLRNVYRDALTTSPARTPTADQVEFSLKDAESGEDSVPVFSQAQTPLSQNAAIGEIMDEIRRDHIRMVEIAATNVLDSLFLAQVLRRQCPNTRLLVTSPDLLFVQEARTASLAGTLAISPYPLFSSSQQWLSEHVPHVNANSQGLYNAIQFFLLPPKDFPQLNDYSWQGQSHPPSWLMTLTHEGFSPLKLMPNSDAHWFKDVTSPLEPHFELPNPPALWNVLAVTFTLASFLICGWILHLDGDSRVLSWSMAAPDGNHIADAHRLTCLICSLLTLAALQAVLLVPFATHYLPLIRHRSVGYQWPQLLLLFGTLFPIAVSLKLLPRVLQKPGNTPIRWAYLTAIFLLFGSLISAWAFCCLRANSRVGFFFSFRALELQVGSSPALPILFFLSGLFIFSVSSLIRFYIAINQRPRMFTAVFDRFFNGKMRNCRRDLNRILVAPMNFSSQRQIAFLAIGLASTALFGLISRINVTVASLEGKTYDWLVMVLAALLALCMIATAVQVHFSWSALQPLLIRLNLLPIGNSFTQLRDAGRNGPIWARRLNLQSLDIPTRSTIVLHNLKVDLERKTCPFNLCPPELDAWIRDYWSILSTLIGNKQDRPAQRTQFLRLRFLGANMSHQLSELVLLPEWRTRTLPWNPALSTPENESVAPQAETRQEDAYALVQTFVALQFSLFINYAVRQIQNLTLSLSLGFGFFVVALNVYSFQSPQTISRFLLLAFLLLGYLVWKIMSQMERDPILSRLSGTSAGELNKEFYLKLIGYGALPALSIITSQFPSIGTFLSSWVQPSLENLK